MHYLGGQCEWFGGPTGLTSACYSGNDRQLLAWSGRAFRRETIYIYWYVVRGFAATRETSRMTRQEAEHEKRGTWTGQSQDVMADKEAVSFNQPRRGLTGANRGRSGAPGAAAAGWAAEVGGDLGAGEEHEPLGQTAAGGQQVGTSTHIYGDGLLVCLWC